VAHRCSEYFCTAGLNSKRSTLLSLSCCALVIHGIYNCSLITIKRCLHRGVAHVVLENTARSFEFETCCLRFPHPPLSLSISPFSFLSSFLSWYFCELQIYRTLWYCTKSGCQRSRCVMDWLCSFVLTTQNVNDILLQTSFKSFDPHLHIFNILI
jgi:hypothetical protein